MDFETEEQQAEAVKKWFSEYGMTIVLGLVIGLGGVFGYRYYNEHQELQMEQASEAYEEVMAVLATDKTKFNDLADKYTEQHGADTYSNLLGLQRAKLAVEAKDLASAESALMAVVSSASHPAVENTARIRLVRIQIALEKYEPALATIAEANTDSYQYNYELLRGDVWLARGDKERAKKAYTKAKALGADNPPHPDLEMLLTELASAGTANKASSGAVND